VRLLGRFSKSIVVSFDPDTAGANAAERSIGILVAEEFNIRILRLEEGYDPDLFIRKKGAAAYAQALQHAPKYFDYLVDRALHTFPVKTPEGKKNAVNYLLPHIHRVPSRIEREGLAADIAQKLGIDSAVLRQEFRSAATGRAKREVQTTADTEITPSEKILVRALSSTLPEEEALRHRATKALLAEGLHAGLATGSLLEALLLHEAGGAEGSRDPLSLPLDDTDRALLARILMREDEPLTPELLEGALDALRHTAQVAKREGEIKRGLEEAERRSDIEALLRLKQEKLELDRKLSRGGGG
jgi:DNA primase